MEVTEERCEANSGEERQVREKISALSYYCPGTSVIIQVPDIAAL